MQMIPSDQHYTPEMMVDYFEGRLDADAECALEEHVATCDTCAALARRYLRFSQAWETLPAPPAPQSEFVRRVQAALAELASDPALAAWHGRLRSWADRSSRLAAAALHMALGGSLGGTRLETGGMEVLTGGRPQWQFALVPSTVAVRGESPPGEDILVAVSTGRPSARVALSGRARELTVRVDAPPPGPPALVALISDGGAPPRVAEMRPIQGGTALIARFSDIAPGSYLVIMEPLEDAADQ